MKILFLTRLFYPHIGGVEKHVLEVGKRLIKNGHQVTILTEVPEGYCFNDLNHLSRVEGMEIFRIPVPRNEKLKKYAIWIWMFKHINLIFNADVIHCHDVFFWYLPFRFLFPFKKVYTTFHGYEGNKIPGKKAILMHKLAEVLSKGNICVGDFFKKWYGTTSTHVTYGAVDIDKILKLNAQTQKDIKNQKSKIKNKWKIVFIGRLEEETGIMEYLRALRIIKNRGYKIHLLVLGDGSQRKEAERFSVLNNLNIEFKGFVQPGKIYEYLNKVDFVFTSRYLGILESFAAKKYVFAVYNNPIKKDYLFLSPFSKFISIAKNDLDLSSEIIHAITNQIELSEKINNAYNFVSKQSWEKLTETYLRLWK